MNYEEAMPVVPSMLEITNVFEGAARVDPCHDAMQQADPERLLIASAQDNSCRILMCDLDKTSTYYSRKAEVRLKFNQKVTSIVFCTEKNEPGAANKPSWLLLVLTRDGRLWCFREHNLQDPGEYEAMSKCSACFSSQRLLGTNTLTTCLLDSNLLVASGNTLGPPQLLRYSSAPDESVISIQSTDIMGMDVVDSAVTTVVCLSKQSLCIKLQRALQERYLSDASLTKLREYDAIVIMGFADGTVRISLVDSSRDTLQTTPVRLLGWLSGKDQQTVVAIVPAVSDRSLVDGLFWFGSNGQTMVVYDDLRVSCIRSAVPRSGELKAVISATDCSDIGPRIVLSARHDGSCYVHAIPRDRVLPRDHVAGSDDSYQLCAKVPIRTGISQVIGVKALHSPNPWSSTMFVAATTTGALTCFRFDQSTGEEILYMRDSHPSREYSLLQQFRTRISSGRQAKRLKGVADNVERLERRAEREAASSDKKLAGDEADNVSQTIQEIYRHREQTRIRVQEGSNGEVAASLDERPLKDGPLRLQLALHAYVPPKHSGENEPSATSIRSSNGDDSRKVLFGGTVMSSCSATDSSPLVFDCKDPSAVSYYTSQSLLTRVGEEVLEGMVFTANVDRVMDSK